LFSLGQKISKEKAVMMNPVVLAFIGDAVHSLYVREELSFNTDCKTGELNKRLSARVNARNTKKGTKSKNSTVAEYNASTGYEAVLGYLYVIGDEERLNYLLNL